MGDISRRGFLGGVIAATGGTCATQTVASNKTDSMNFVPPGGRLIVSAPVLHSAARAAFQVAAPLCFLSTNV